MWRDADWDQWYIYEILKQKLIDQEKGIRTGYSVDADKDADNILKAIKMIEIVQNEEIIDEYITKGEFNRETMKECYAKQEKAKQDLFKFLADHIDSWWD